MEYIIKSGKRGVCKPFSKRFGFGSSVMFKFRLGNPCFHPDEDVIHTWNRIMGISRIGSGSSVDVVWLKHHDSIMIGLKHSLNGKSHGIIKRLGEVLPDKSYLCEIDFMESIHGCWFYRIIIEPIEQNNKNLYWSFVTSKKGFPLMVFRQPKLGGRYTLKEDCVIDIDFIG